MIGSVVGAHPYPYMVREFQKVIGVEAREQCLERYGRLPTDVVACVGGGSNAMGIFAGFVDDPRRETLGRRSSGRRRHERQTAASLKPEASACCTVRVRILLQTPEGQVRDTHSISAGLDYPGVGPEHAYLKEADAHRT